jgi:hypothetical protein
VWNGAPSTDGLSGFAVEAENVEADIGNSDALTPHEHPFAKQREVRSTIETKRVEQTRSGWALVEGAAPQMPLWGELMAVCC